MLPLFNTKKLFQGIIFWNPINKKNVCCNSFLFFFYYSFASPLLFSPLLFPPLSCLSTSLPLPSFPFFFFLFLSFPHRITFIIGFGWAALLQVPSDSLPTTAKHTVICFSVYLTHNLNYPEKKKKNLIYLCIPTSDT